MRQLGRDGESLENSVRRKGCGENNQKTSDCNCRCCYRPIDHVRPEFARWLGLEHEAACQPKAISKNAQDEQREKAAIGKVQTGFPAIVSIKKRSSRYPRMIQKVWKSISENLSANDFIPEKSILRSYRC